jgi:hypothetical protein
MSVRYAHHPRGRESLLISDSSLPKARGGVPPGSELVFERGAGTIGIGAVDVLEARVLVLGR